MIGRDWYGYPLPQAGAWNVLNHHIGISEAAGIVGPPGANLCVFQDLRNNRGVIIAYADGEAKADATVELPIKGLTAEDIMGNPVEIESGKLVLSRTGRPVVLYTAAKSGKEFNYRKQSALVFIVPESGVYRIKATASSKPWGGKGRVAHLYIMKRDEQRAGENLAFDDRFVRERLTVSGKASSPGRGFDSPVLDSL